MFYPITQGKPTNPVGMSVLVSNLSSFCSCLPC